MVRQTFCKILLAAVVVVFGVLALSGILFAQGRSADAFERVAEVQARHTEALMARPGVVGTAIGLEHGGVPDIPGALEGVPVRPLVTGKIYALPKPDNPGNGKGGGGGGGDDPVDPTARFDRPVPIGVSTGHPDITAGTIGCRVTDGTNVYALSNNHVYANENDATVGDAVIQPGTADGGIDPLDDPIDVIGTLDDFLPIVFYDYDNPPPPDEIPTNTIDAAIALSSEADLGNSTPSSGYGVPKSAIIAAEVGMKVKKYGRTTELTTGRVDAVNAIVDVGYDSGVARFVDQIIIVPGSFSAGGDSGSLVVVDGKGRDKANDRRPVGLLFAGSAFVTIANPIDAVLGEFGVTSDGE
jgi:hypothetical protein